MKSIAIFGSSELGKRPWRPDKKIWAVAIFGSSELDFRQAALEEGITQVTAVSIFGGTDIFVAEDMPVTLSGFSLLGSRELKRSRATEMPPASAKALHINAISIFGSCEVGEGREKEKR